MSDSAGAGGLVRKTGREVFLFAVFLAVAVVLTWPLATSMPTALSDLGDPLLVTWILDWNASALVHQPLHLFDAPMFHPAKYPLAFSENLVMQGLMMVPFRQAGFSPVTIYNIATLLGFALAGYGASVLARTLGRSTFASVIAGLLFAFGQYEFDHLAHLQILWCGWLPLMFAALFFWHRRPGWVRGGLVAAAFVANGLSNIHFLVFGGFALFLTIVFLMAAAAPRRARDWAGLAVALAIGAMVLVPVLLPYRTVAKLYGMTRIEPEVASGSAQWSDWLLSGTRNRIWGRMTIPNDRAERHLFPGGMALLMTLAALLLVPAARRDPDDPPARPRAPWWLRGVDLAILLLAWASLAAMIAADPYELRMGHKVLLKLHGSALPFTYLLVLLFVRIAIRMPLALTGGVPRTLRDAVARSRFSSAEWSAAIWIATGLIGSFGTYAFLHTFLFRRVELFHSIRTPARWAIIVYLGLVVWSALGVDALLRNRRGLGRAVATVLVSLLAVVDVWAVVRWESIVPQPAPVYEWIVKEKVKGPFLELPMNVANSPFLYLQGSTIHHQPIFNGTSGFEPPLHRTLRTMEAANEYDKLFLMLLEANGCRYVIVHTHLLTGDAAPLKKWLQAGLESGRLAIVRRFTHELTGDYVFAVTAVTKDWQPLSRGFARDAAGLTDGLNLLRWFNGEPPYNESTFGAMELPQADAEITGPMTVKGIALSPDGIRRVEVRIHSGRVVRQARLLPRPEITKLWPWYRTATPGFELELSHRPKGVPRDTDVQAVIIDGKGRELRLTDHILHWN